MRLGAYTACLHDKPLTETLRLLREVGLNSAEINAGGFLPAPHIPVDGLLSGAVPVEDYLAPFRTEGVELTGLNVNGNPLHPQPDVGAKQAGDLYRAIELGALLGVERVVAMSGLPAAHAGGTSPSWQPLPWNSVHLDARDHQWNEVLIPFWKDVDAHARAAGVKVCIEMHPHMAVFNPRTLERLVTETGATHVGAEMDPSHLFWQGIDPIRAVEHLGGLVFHAAAKDTRINDLCAVNGVLDDGFGRVPEEEGPIHLGGGHTLSRWPSDSSWDFVAVGRGHDQDYWARFLAALHKVDPAMAVNIEHEDEAFGQVEGLRLAAQTLTSAAKAAGVDGG